MNSVAGMVTHSLTDARVVCLYTAGITLDMSYLVCSFCNHVS